MVFSKIRCLLLVFVSFTPQRLPNASYSLLKKIPYSKLLVDIKRLGDMNEGGAKGNKQQEGQRYVRRLVGYVLGRRRE
jgi:hypothetical protein